MLEIKEVKYGINFETAFDVTNELKTLLRGDPRLTEIKVSIPNKNLNAIKYLYFVFANVNKANNNADSNVYVSAIFLITTGQIQSNQKNENNKISIGLYDGTTAILPKNM